MHSSPEGKGASPSQWGSQSLVHGSANQGRYCSWPAGQKGQAVNMLEWKKSKDLPGSGTPHQRVLAQSLSVPMAAHADNFLDSLWYSAKASRCLEDFSAPLD